MALSRFMLEPLETRALLHGTGFEAMVNFQPASSPAPAGYLVDAGAVFGDRGNGSSYGWDIDNARFARDRNSPVSPDQRYDTLNQMKRLGGGTTWDIAVPNGTYEVRLVAGDAAAYDSIYAINVEGVLALSGKPSSSVRWFTGTTTVTVADGRLTVTNAPGSFNNKICFIEIHQLDAPSLPVVSVTASDPSAAEAGRDPGKFVVSRDGDTSAPLTVRYTVDGTATSGADYAALGATVVIPAGATSAVLSVDPVDDAAAEANETVVLRLIAFTTYELSAATTATVTIADNDAPVGGFSAKVDFQPPGSAVFPGYIADEGAVFGDRGNGLSYGWDVINTAYARDRNAANSPDQRYDTFNSMQRAGAGSVWEIAVPNGTYSVRIVAGDATAYDSVYAINAEGVLVVSGRPTSTVKWIEGTQTITVADGRLTLTNAAGSANNKVAFIDITADETDPQLPHVTVAASDAAASETAGNPGSFTVTRTGPTDAPLVVNLAIGGSATSGADYSAIATSVTIPAGAASVQLVVQPVDDSAVEASETVTLSIVPGPGYTAGAASATVSIADNDSAPGTTLTWTAVARPDIGRSEGMGAVVNGKLYLFGGYVDTTYRPTNRGDVYNPATNTWTQVADLPFGVSHMGTVALGDSIYFASGYPATATNQTFSTTAVWRYDTVGNRFSNLPNLPAARGGGALVAVGRALHFVGGSDSARRDAAQHWRLDLDNLTAGWVARAPLPVATNHVAGVALDGKVYIIGGQQNQDAAAIQRGEVQVYDPATNQWSARAPLPLARSHITSSTLVRNGQIIVLGGIGPGNSVIKRVDGYNPVTNTWTPLTSLPANRLSGVSDVLPDGRLIFSTGSMTRDTWIGTFA